MIVYHPSENHVDVRINEQRCTEHQNEPRRIVADARRVDDTSHAENVASRLRWDSLADGSHGQGSLTASRENDHPAVTLAISNRLNKVSGRGGPEENYEYASSNKTGTETP